MSDLAALSARVVAAQEHLGQVEAERRQMGGRLLELVNGVEAALARKQAEIEAYQATIEALRGEAREHLATMEALRDENQGHLAGIEALRGENRDHLATIQALRDETQGLRVMLDQILGAIEQAGESRVGDAVANLSGALASLSGRAQAGTEAAAVEAEAAADGSDLSDEWPGDETLPGEFPVEAPAETSALDMPAGEMVGLDEAALATTAGGDAWDAAAPTAADAEDMDPGDFAAAAEADDTYQLGTREPLAQAPEAAGVEWAGADEILADAEDLGIEAAEALDIETADDAEALADGMAGDSMALEAAFEDEPGVVPDAPPGDEPDAMAALALEAEPPAAGADETILLDPIDSLPPGDPARVKAIIERVSRLADEMAVTMGPEAGGEETAIADAKPRARKAAAS